MSNRYLAEMLTPEALDAQTRTYGRRYVVPPRVGTDALGPMEEEMFARTDSLFLASVTSDGWPYVQHRGGPRGFVRVLDANTIAFADFRGNRQLVSTGNIGHDDRVAMIVVDYERRERLKLIGHAKIVDPSADPELAAAVTPPGAEHAVERIVRIEVVGLDWNCPAHIPRRVPV